jgi:hypothetical protein
MSRTGLRALKLKAFQARLETMPLAAFQAG